MYDARKTTSRRSLRWLWTPLAAAILMVPALVQEAAAEGGKRGAPERPSIRSNKGSSGGGGRSSSSAGRSSSRGKVGSVSSHSSGGSRGYSGPSRGSSSSSSAGKIESIRRYQGSGGSSGGGSGGSSGGGYYYGGHHHYGGYYDYYPSWGWYVGFGHRHPYYSHYYSWYWPYFRPYYPYYYYPHYSRYPHRVVDYRAMGALDLNVKPKSTEVYVDGHFVGTTGELDGIPRYLWLEEGTYEVIFYSPGYRTLAREYTIHPDLVIKVKERMEPGVSVEPAELSRASGPPPRADTRVEVERAWRRPPQGEPPARPAPRAAPPSAGDTLDARSAPGTVLLEIEPADASVYLDGRFLGTGEDLSESPSGLLVDPGVHRLEVVHPGYQSRELDFEAVSGQSLSFEVELAERARADA